MPHGFGEDRLVFFTLQMLDGNCRPVRAAITGSRIMRWREQYRFLEDLLKPPGFAAYQMPQFTSELIAAA